MQFNSTHGPSAVRFGSQAPINSKFRTLIRNIRTVLPEAYEFDASTVRYLSKDHKTGTSVIEVDGSGGTFTYTVSKKGNDTKHVLESPKGHKLILETGSSSSLRYEPAGAAVEVSRDFNDKSSAEQLFKDLGQAIQQSGVKPQQESNKPAPKKQGNWDF